MVLEKNLPKQETENSFLSENSAHNLVGSHVVRVNQRKTGPVEVAGNRGPGH